jgi:hypothetical protein
MHVPLQLAEIVRLQRKFISPDHLYSGLLTLALLVSHRDERIP